MFCGELERDAPGVFHSLTRLALAPPDLETIKAAYREAWSRGDLQEERGSLRTPGTSFNPRPARLMSLAVKELQSFLATDLFLLLLTALAANPLTCRSDPPDSPASITPFIDALVRLDDLRHRHLRTPESLTHPIPASLDPSLLSVLPVKLAAMLQTAYANALSHTYAKNP